MIEHRIGSHPEHQSVESSRPMRKIINSTYIALDGVIEGPHVILSYRTGEKLAEPA